MSFKEIYNKENEIVKKNTREAQMAFYEGIENKRNELNMKVGEVANKADVGPAMMSRLQDPDTNLTMQTMQRFAAATGQKVVISFEDLDENGE